MAHFRSLIARKKIFCLRRKARVGETKLIVIASAAAFHHRLLIHRYEEILICLYCQLGWLFSGNLLCFSLRLFILEGEKNLCDFPFHIISSLPGAGIKVVWENSFSRSNISTLSMTRKLSFLYSETRVSLCRAMRGRNSLLMLRKCWFLLLTVKLDNGNVVTFWFPKINRKRSRKVYPESGVRNVNERWKKLEIAFAWVEIAFELRKVSFSSGYNKISSKILLGDSELLASKFWPSIVCA